MAVSVSDGGTASGSQQLPVLDIPRPFEALSDVSNDSSHNGRDCDSQDLASSERLSQPPPVFSSSAVPTTRSTSSPGRTIPAGRQEASLSSSSKSRKKPKKHKEKGKNKDREKEKRVKKSQEDCELSPGNVKATSIPDESTGESHTSKETFSASVQKTHHYSLTGPASGGRVLNRSSLCAKGHWLVII